MILNFSRLKKRAISDFPRQGAIYIIALVVNGQPWYYVGQTENAWKRIVDGHDRPSYRSTYKRSFLYWLWSQASEYTFCFAVSDKRLRRGPIANILEHWVSLMFLALQPREMATNFPPKEFAKISPDALEYGAGVREPLAETFTLAEYPMRGSPYQQSPQLMKRLFYQYKENLPAPDRAAPFVRGDLFDGHFTVHGRQSRFHLGRLQFEIPSSFVDALVKDTIWVRCDLVRSGDEHPHPILAPDFVSHLIWQDPARRLGIQFGGLRKLDQQAVSMWIRKSGDHTLWIPRCNYLVDWLEGLNPNGVRPRRWFPGSEGSRGAGTYTRHPIDFFMDGDTDLFDAWDIPVSRLDYKTWYLERP